MVRTHPDPPSAYRGGVAQLGERLLCKQEVIGSIPFTSTILETGNERPGWKCAVSRRHGRCGIPCLVSDGCLLFNNSEEVKCIGLMRVDAWVVIA